MLWDNEYLYIGAMLHEPHVWATLTKRDSVIFYDNDFEVFIDPDSDNHQYYEIEINALNTVWDLLLIKPYRDGGPAVNGWDIAGLKTAVHIDGTLNVSSDQDQGWSLEMAIPWASLKECANKDAPPKPGDSWRINFSRVEWETSVVDGRYVKTPHKPEHNWVWSPQGVVDMHRPEKWGYVSFSNETNFGLIPDEVHKSTLLHRDLPPDLLKEEDSRQALMELYYSQKAYHLRTGRYANLLTELGITNPAISLLAISSAYLGTYTLHTGKSSEIWHIREDSRIWKAPVKP